MKNSRIKLYKTSRISLMRINHTSKLFIFLSQNAAAQLLIKALAHLFRNVNKYLPNLKSLTLEFQKCEEINDNGIELLALELSQGLGNLRSLVLNFNECDRISDHGLKSLEGPIRHLNKLITFKLAISGYNRITVKGLERIAEKIGENMKDLKHLVLEFDGNFKVSQECLQKINQKVGYIYDFTLFHNLS